VLLDRAPSQHPTIVAAAHGPHWDDDLDDYDHTSADTLRHRWHQGVVEAGAHLLALGSDAGGPAISPATKPSTPAPPSMS
jgi:hypothetical protein